MSLLKIFLGPVDKMSFFSTLLIGLLVAFYSSFNPKVLLALVNYLNNVMAAKTFYWYHNCKAPVDTRKGGR